MGSLQHANVKLTAIANISIRHINLIADSPLTPGSSWVGTSVYDYCTTRKPDAITLVINSFQKKPYFGNKAQVSALLVSGHEPRG